MEAPSKAVQKEITAIKEKRVVVDVVEEKKGVLEKIKGKEEGK